MAQDFPRSLPAFQRFFSDEAACATYLFEARWPEGFRCPQCGHDQAWELKGKAFTYECRACARQTSVRAGTVMHGSKLALMTWFWAAYLMATHSNGISATQLQKQLGLGSYKTAWLLCAKLRHAMTDPDRNPLGGLIETDESALNHRTKDEPVAGGQGRSHDGKLPIIAAVEVINDRPGRLRLSALADYSASSLHGFVKANIAPGATVRTDGWSGYQGMTGVTHDPHVIGTMAAHVVLPWVHRIFSNLKTWALGVYHGLRPKHLQAYLDEFTFRFNRRKTRHAAFRSLIKIATRKNHVTYKMLVLPETGG